jgi:Uri superfamily endonuclease
MRTYINSVSEFPASGIYMLLIHVSREVTLTVGKLGKQRFPRGYYVYTGSALGKGATSLKHRIARHLRKEKRRFWHIDYLLADENVSVEAVIAAETNENMECNINQHIKSIMETKIPVKGFGASDCRKNCGSHLLYFPAIENSDFLVQKLVRHLQSVGEILSVCAVH